MLMLLALQCPSRTTSARSTVAIAHVLCFFRFEKTRRRDVSCIPHGPLTGHGMTSVFRGGSIGLRKMLASCEKTTHMDALVEERVDHDDRDHRSCEYSCELSAHVILHLQGKGPTAHSARNR